VHFCFLTPLERAFFFHFSQLPLWKKWLIPPLENEVLDRGGTGIKCNSPFESSSQQNIIYFTRLFCSLM
jgi:hypothetical protein